MPAVSTFDSTKTDLSELLTNARTGDAQLPDFQRGWVWDDEHIRDLIASVSRSFPIGTVMLLESGGEVNFRTRPLEGATPGDVTPGELILDGQQRLTSLFQALVSENPVATRDSKGNEVSRWYYLDISMCLDPNNEREDAVLSIPEDRVIRSNFGRDVELDVSDRSGEYEAHLFPLSQVFDYYDWAAGYREFYAYDPEVSRRWDEFERDVIQRFRGYQLPVIRLHKQTPKEAVCLVFEKVNTGGVSLTVFELLTATFAAVAPPDFQLRADWEVREERLHEQPVLREVSNTDFIQVVSLLASRARRLDSIEGGAESDRAPAISCKRRDMLRLGFDEYARWADEIVEGFERAARFLHRERIFDTKFLPYGSQLVALAAVLTIVGDRALEQPAIRNKLVRWFWCGVFGELYGSATETRFARDLPDLLEWIDDDDATPRTIQEANFAPDRLLTLRTRRSAAYKGLYVLLLREGARDFRTGETSTDQNYFDEAIDIHHVFPKKWCADRTPEPVPSELVESIVNKTPLTARTNRIVGGRAPSDYLSSLRENHGVSDAEATQNLGSHLVDPTAMRSDDFELYFQLRAKAMYDAIERVTGKTMLGEAATSSTPNPAFEALLPQGPSSP